MKTTAETWVLFGSCNEGRDVLGIWNGEKPNEIEIQETILRLPMFVYGEFRVELCGGKVQNWRAKSR